MIRVRVFGKSEIAIGRRRLTPASEVLYGLALYLTVRAGERVRRDDILPLFWGEDAGTNGRHSLRQMLYKLRLRGFRPAEVGTDLQFEPAELDSELNAVLDETWPERATAEEVEHAALAMAPAGERMLPAYREWHEALRDRVAAQHRKGALRQLARARREARWHDLERLALQVLRTDPLNEEATLARAEGAAMAGSKAMALEILDQYMEELGPRAERIGLPATVLRRRIAERRQEWGSRGRWSGREVPLVGREALVGELTELAHPGEAGLGSAITLWGAQGIGKTRVATAVIEHAELSGARTIRLAGSTISAAPLLSVATRLAGSLVELPGALGASPLSLAVLRRAASPPTGETFDASTAGAQLDPHAVSDALLEVLLAVSEECRLAILVDDFDRLDVEAQRLLARLASGAQRTRVTWVLARRSRPGASEVAEVFRHPRSHVVRLEPLSREEALRLARSVGLREGREEEVERAAPRLEAACGNPLFLLELVQLFLSAEAPAEVPPSLGGLIAQRLDSFPAPAVRVLRAAAQLAEACTVRLLKTASGLEHEEFAAPLEFLADEGVLQLNPDGRVTMHSAWQHAVLDAWSPLARGAGALRAAEALLESDSRQLDAAALGRAAELLAEAGESERAKDYYCQLADHLLDRNLIGEALRVLSGPMSRSAERSYRIMVRVARALDALGELEALVELASADAGEPEAAHSEEVAAWGTLASLVLQARVRLRLDHRDSYERVRRIASDPLSAPDVRQLACLVGLVVASNDTGSPDEDHFKRTAAHLDTVHGATPIGTLVSLIHAAEHGQAEEARHADICLQRMEAQPLPDRLRCRVLRARASAMRWLGELEDARAIGQRAMALALQCGLRTDALVAVENLAFLALEAELLDEFWATRDRWLSLCSDRDPFERRLSLVHATSRAFSLAGKFALALESYSAEFRDFSLDSMGKRRAADAAALAICYAGLSQRREAESALRESIGAVESYRPGLQMDSIAAMSVEALTLLGDRQRATELIDHYMARRTREFRLPMAKSHASRLLASD